MTRVGLVTLLVHEYDAAIAWFVEKLGFVVHQDTPLTESKRWVVVGPADSTGTRILLAKAATEGQQARIGDQTAARVFLFLETDDFARDHARLREPRREVHRGTPWRELRNRRGVRGSLRQSMGSHRASVPCRTLTRCLGT